MPNMMAPPSGPAGDHSNRYSERCTPANSTLPRKRASRRKPPDRGATRAKPSGDNTSRGGGSHVRRGLSERDSGDPVARIGQGSLSRLPRPGQSHDGVQTDVSMQILCEGSREHMAHLRLHRKFVHSPFAYLLTGGQCSSADGSN